MSSNEQSELTAVFSKFRNEGFPCALSATKNDEAKALYAFIRILAKGREDTIVATSEQAVQLLREYLSKPAKVAAGAAGTEKGGLSNVNQEQAHTFPTLHIRKRTFDEASLSDKPDPNKSPVQEFVTGSDEAPATPTPDSRKRTKESTMPGTPDTPSNRIDAFSSAQRAISEAIANSPKRNTRQNNKGKVLAAVPEVGESSKARGGSQRRIFGRR